METPFDKKAMMLSRHCEHSEAISEAGLLRVKITASLCSS